jgi:curved DNA-binding protein CbpA
MNKHYKTLGLENGASQEEIQTAYERLSNELNPANNDNLEFFVEEFTLLKEAYEALSNSSILATEKGARINTTDNIVKEKRDKETDTNEKEPKSVKNLKGYLVLIFFVLVGLGPTLVVYYYEFYGYEFYGYYNYYSSINTTELLEMDFLNKFYFCFKETFKIKTGYHRNYFLFIFIYIIILSIFLSFRKKVTTKKDSKILKSENQIQVSSGKGKHYKPNPKEALEKLKQYKELLELNVITKEEYTKYVKEFRCILLKEINK